MKLTNKLKAEINKFYNDYWDAYLAGDMKTFASMLDDNIKVFGTAVSEVFNNKAETVRFYKATADQMTGKAEFRNRKIKMFAVDETVLIHEQNNLFVLIENEWNFYGPARVSALLVKTLKGWKVAHQHGSFPDSRAEAGEQIAPEIIKKENLELREAIIRRTVELEEKNRELEIETALEKVRAVALGMKNPEDMLEICKTISKQLEKLGINEVRNVQTAIFYQQSGTYTNYEYYAKHDKTFTTETTYTNNELHQEFAEKMLKGKGEFFITHIKGKEVIDWIAYQKTTNVFIDKYLESAPSLNYYWFSLGPVALGISTYQPLAEEEINLFKRFLKVFELSYQRYLDIEKAEAQAREAQIEAALERVRSKSMAMYTSADLSVVVFEMFIELIKLDAQLDRCIIMIVDPQTLDINWYLSGKEGLLSKNGFLIQNNTHPSHQAYLEGWRTKRKKWNYHLAGDEKKNWDTFGFTQTGLAQLPDFIKLDMSAVESIHLTISSDDFGCLIASSLSPLSDPHADIVERFTKVFNQTYTRFLDLQKAEKQAREAIIELSLERIRAQVTAMKESADLLDIVVTMRKEFVALGHEAHYFWHMRYLPEKYEKAMTSRDGTRIGMVMELPRHIHCEIKLLADWEKSDKPTVVYAMDVEAALSYVDKMINLGDFKLVDPNAPTHDDIRHIEGLTFVMARTTHGEIGYSLPGIKTDPPAEDLNTLLRFAGVFDLAYRRFEDLKEAEIQYKIIQAENERKSKELEDARELQLSMLPKELPSLPHLEIAVYMKTATEVGGDYYDYNVDNNGNLTVLVGDATGHGMMSGMMVSIMKSFFISNRNEIDLKQFFKNANKCLKDMKLGRLMMALIGVQLTAEKVIATNAGLPSLIYYRKKSGKAGEFVSNNMPLGAMNGITYALKEMKHERGDTLLLMTDGFGELKNIDGEQYGYPRIKDEFQSVAEKSPGEIISHLKTSADEWKKGVEPDDDMTFIVIKIK